MKYLNSLKEESGKSEPDYMEALCCNQARIPTDSYSVVSIELEEIPQIKDYMLACKQ